MQNTWYLFILLMLVITIYLPGKRRKRYAANKLNIKRRIINMEDSGRKKMKELAERLIGKDVYIKLLEGNADGILKEVTESGIVLENNGHLQVLNLNYVIKIREYPYKKGKRATIWSE